MHKRYFGYNNFSAKHTFLYILRSVAKKSILFCEATLEQKSHRGFSLTDPRRNQGIITLFLRKILTRPKLRGLELKFLSQTLSSI